MPDELLAAIRSVSAGDAVVSPRLTRLLLDAHARHLHPPEQRPRGTDPRLCLLSDRERGVLIAIGNGWTNTEIAERLHLSESTVKKLAKLEARDRVQAVIIAYDTGLVRATP